MCKDQGQTLVTLRDIPLQATGALTPGTPLSLRSFYHLLPALGHK